MHINWFNTQSSNLHIHASKYLILLFISFLQDLFTAGTDTSAATIEWAMAERLQSPSSPTKAHDELSQAIGSKQEIEESDIRQLKYIQAIVKEMFRLPPLAPLLLPRQAAMTTEIRGYTVPKGARVLVNVWAIRRDRELWAEPEKFMAERFLGKEIGFRGKTSSSC
jgi:cytochrome P450